MCIEEAWFGAYSGSAYKWKRDDATITWFPDHFDGVDMYMRFRWSGEWDDVSYDLAAEGYLCEIDGE